MSEPDTERTGFFAELKRRRVIPVGILYAVVGVGVVEAADLFLPRLQAPDWTVTVLVVLVVAGFPVAIVLAWIYQITPAGLRRSEWLVGDAAESEWITPVGIAVEDDGRRSIAVLPFVNMSADPEQEYFGDGMSEELINALTKLEDLRVAARTSAFAFKGKEQGVRTIGRKLGVDTVLEGSVRKAGNKLRITAQLINVADGYHLWSETYDRELEDVFAIQDEISQSIVSTLQLKLALGEGETLAQVGTTDLEAYELYLKGRHYWYKRYEVGLQTALGFFQKAIEKDPEFALPYTGLADAFTLMGSFGFIPPEQARSAAFGAAERALALDDRLAEAHFVMGRARGLLQWDLDGAERSLQRATELNPTHALAMVTRALLCHYQGRLEEGIAMADRAGALDPDLGYVAACRGIVRFLGGRYEEAIRVLEWAIEREPEEILALYVLGATYSAVSRHDEAIALQKRVAALTNRAPAFLGWLGSAYGQAGMDGEALGVLEELQLRSAKEYVTPVSLAVVCSSTGRIEEAFAYLEAALDEQSPTLGFWITTSVWDPLRSDSRFQSILQRIGLE